MSSKLETEFALRWMAHGGPLAQMRWQREFRFDPVRKWRFDFAIMLPPAKVAVEVEGGVWAGGRHNRAPGFIADCEKYNAAALAGWTVFRLTKEMMTRENIEAISTFIARKLKGIG